MMIDFKSSKTITIKNLKNNFNFKSRKTSLRKNNRDDIIDD